MVPYPDAAWCFFTVLILLMQRMHFIDRYSEICGDALWCIIFWKWAHIWKSESRLCKSFKNSPGSYMSERSKNVGMFMVRQETVAWYFPSPELKLEGKGQWKAHAQLSDIHFKHHCTDFLSHCSVHGQALLLTLLPCAVCSVSKYHCFPPDNLSQQIRSF